MKDFSIKVNGEKVRGVIENENQQKIIILVHGFTGDMNGPADLFKKFSLNAQAEGYSICRFDCRGTGESDGDFEDMTVEGEVQDLLGIIEYIRSIGYTDISLLGESMGATVISSLEDFSGFDSIIFWYPAFDLYDTELPRFLEKTEQKLLKEQGFVDCDGYNVGKPFIDQIEKIKTYNNLSKISCDTVIIHGDSDKDVPLEQSIKAMKLIKSENKKLEIIQGADHCFRNEQDAVIKKTLNFILKV